MIATMLLTLTIQKQPLIQGVDHVVVAVKDLDKAVETYQSLGFAIKSGTNHDNGIVNAHVKFPDGTEIELLSVPEQKDDLAREYKAFLEIGEGPAFASLFAPDLEAVSKKISREHHLSSAMLTFPEGDPLRYLFFGKRQKSPTDEPKHLAHKNSAARLQRVWIAADDVRAERNLLRSLGAQLTDGRIDLTYTVQTSHEQIGDGEVVFFPASFQTKKGRKIVGVTILVDDIMKTKEIFSDIFAPPAQIFEHSVLVRPEETHGLWIEFRTPKS